VKKFGGHHNYEEDYAKALKGPCLAHPKSNYTLENCKVLKEIYHHKQASENADKPNDTTGQRNRRDDDEDDPDKNPKHQYQEPVRHVITIVEGNVSVESKCERKLLARARLNMAKTDNLIADPTLPSWSHREINFSRVDQWASIPKLGHFALVLSPYINKVQFDRVLIDGGSSIDILFKNSLSALNISEADLKPYDTQFWGSCLDRALCLLGRLPYLCSLAWQTTFVPTTSTLWSLTLRVPTMLSLVARDHQIHGCTSLQVLGAKDAN
jgi:hypothetical protein